MAFKPTHVRRNSSLPLYMLSVELSHIRSRQLLNMYIPNIYKPSYVN